MTLKNLSFKHIAVRFSRDLGSLALTAEALAIGVGWLALITLLSFGGVALLRTFGAASADVDLPLNDPDYDRKLAIDSALVLGGCTAVVALVELVRRWRRVR